MPAADPKTSTSAAKYFDRRYERVYHDSEWQDLIHDCNKRTGIPMAYLKEVDEIDRLQELMDTTRREHEVDAFEASSYLDADEARRVIEFVLHGTAGRRTLLIGKHRGLRTRHV